MSQLQAKQEGEMKIVEKKFAELEHQQTVMRSEIQTGFAKHDTNFERLIQMMGQGSLPGGSDERRMKARTSADSMDT